MTRMSFAALFLVVFTFWEWSAKAQSHQLAIPQVDPATVIAQPVDSDNLTEKEKAALAYKEASLYFKYKPYYHRSRRHKPRHHRRRLTSSNVQQK